MTTDSLIVVLNCAKQLIAYCSLQLRKLVVSLHRSTVVSIILNVVPSCDRNYIRVKHRPQQHPLVTHISLVCRRSRPSER